MSLSVSEKIKVVLKRRGMTMGQLAEQTNQTRQNLSNKMTRDNFPERELREIADAIDDSLLRKSGVYIPKGKTYKLRHEREAGKPEKTVRMLARYEKLRAAASAAVRDALEYGPAHTLRALKDRSRA